jgi:hypothetical protein
MKKRILFLSIILSASASRACDVCGCAMGAFSQGIMPDYSAHFVGFRYNWSQFYAQVDHENSVPATENSTDTYQRLDLVARYNISKKLKLNLALPYIRNSMQGSHQTLTNSGLGDPIFVVQYQLWTESLVQKNHFLTLGSGMKFPLGKSNLIDNGALVNRNFQMGTGSFDFLITANYFYRKGKSGINLETSYKLNTKNKEDYRFGNQFNFASNYVFLSGKNKFSFLAYGGLYAEHAAPHTENQVRVFNTGGFGVYSNTGVQCYFSKIRISAGFQYPIYQNFQTDNITTINAKPRFNADLIFFFGK